MAGSRHDNEGKMERATRINEERKALYGEAYVPVVEGGGTADPQGRHVRPDTGDPLADALKAFGQERRRTDVAREPMLARSAHQVIMARLDEDATNPINQVDRIARAFDEGGREAVLALRWASVSVGVEQGVDWDGPEEPDWLVRRYILANRLVSLYGHGAVGKTRLAVQLGVAAALGLATWLPQYGTWGVPDPVLTEHPRGGGRRVAFFSWEDSRRSAKRLVQGACEGLRVSLSEARGTLEERFHFYSVQGIGPLWGPSPSDPHAPASLTDAGHWLLRQLTGYDLVVLDSLASLYADDENRRDRVRPFLNAFDTAARERACTVVVIGHSSTQKNASGSTDWTNGVRNSLVVRTMFRALDRKTGKELDANPGTAAYRKGVERIGTVMEVAKLNEAKKPPAVWLASSGKGGGWHRATQDDSEGGKYIPKQGSGEDE